MTENIIEVKNLTKIYEDGNVLAVDDVSFNIKKGEIFALLGPNGAGKTTMISMLTTLLFPTKGTATVNSYNIEKDQHQVRKSIGIIFQEPSLDGDMKGWENLELHAILYGMPRKERRTKINEVLKLVDLEDRADDFVRNYSGGMKRRLELARGLLHSPNILFLDEPTLGLDPQTKRKIWEKIKELNHDFEMTILLTTHLMDEADELADRICIMDHGKIIVIDTSENLKKQLSGDVIDISFEDIENRSIFPNFIVQIREMPGVKNISFDGSQSSQDLIDLILNNLILPPNMSNLNPEIIKRRIRDMISDPKKFIRAWKRFPLASQIFLNATLEVKKKIANLFTDDLLDQIPDGIKQEIIKIKKGEYIEEDIDFGPRLSISCEHGGKELPMIIQEIINANLFYDNIFKIKDIHMHRPTLEDAFLFYTGSEIREKSGNFKKGVKKLNQMRQLRKRE